jgi:hypothetical protein
MHPPEHDGLDPLAPFATGQALAKRTRIASHQRLTKLVAIVLHAIKKVTLLAVSTY